jgi:hypothetical protein
MKTSICVLLTLAGLCVVPGQARAQQPFVYRPHYIHERQLIPNRRLTYDDYYLRKYGRLPAGRVYVAPEPVLPPGYRWGDVWVQGYGYVPADVPPD